MASTPDCQGNSKGLKLVTNHNILSGARVRYLNIQPVIINIVFTCDHPDDDEDHDDDVVDDVKAELAEAARHLVTAGRIVLQTPAFNT